MSINTVTVKYNVSKNKAQVIREIEGKKEILNDEGQWVEWSFNAEHLDKDKELRVLVLGPFKGPPD